MKTISLKSTTMMMFASTAAAFAPQTKLAFRHAATRTFSRSSIAMMAGNPKGMYMAVSCWFCDDFCSV